MARTLREGGYPTFANCLRPGHMSWHLPALCAFVVAWLAPCTAIAAESPPPNITGFKQHIAPLLARYCVDCHSAEDPEADLSLTEIDPNLLDGKDFETWRIIHDRHQFFSLTGALLDILLIRVFMPCVPHLPSSRFLACF